MKRIKIFITGGTFDKEYNELNGSLFFRKTHLPEMLKFGRCRLSIKTETLMMIDSLDMKNKDRELIFSKILNSEEDRILISHGTDTMVETAKFISSRIKDKTIVLFGAMIPYRFGSSDGFLNLGSALAFVQTLPRGVYIAMNGRYFKGDNCRKNKNKGEFEKIK
jgi:L-asparaginase